MRLGRTKLPSSDGAADPPNAFVLAIGRPPVIMVMTVLEDGKNAENRVSFPIRLLQPARLNRPPSLPRRCHLGVLRLSQCLGPGSFAGDASPRNISRLIPGRPL